eukprot:6214783-Pleurochrysis_carterae.AAC.1
MLSGDGKDGAQRGVLDGGCAAAGSWSGLVDFVAGAGRQACRTAQQSRRGGRGTLQNCKFRYGVLCV